MSLKKIKRWSRQVGVKMTLWYLFLFGLSSILLFAVFYVLFSRSLVVRDHEILDVRAQEYSIIYKGGGLEGLKTYLQLEGPSKEIAEYFVRVMNAEKINLYTHVPQSLTPEESSEIEQDLEDTRGEPHWIYVKTRMKEDDVEIAQIKLSDGTYLLVGKTVDDRYDLLNRFKDSFIVILLFAILLGGIGGLLLSLRTLQPLRNLITTIKSVNTGDESARVAPYQNDDELQDLTVLFNQMLDRIQFSNQAMRQTLDTVAHELRTPLTSVRGMAEMTLAKNSTTQEYRDVLADVVEGVDDVLAEFKIMTDITEVETGLKTLRKEKVYLQALCAEVLDLYEIVAEQKDIKFNFKLGPEVTVLADRKKIKQVVANLVDNAIKYSSSGHEVRILCSQGGGSATLQVQDEGMGISENELPHIWKRLYRGERSRREKGLGLGLSLVKSIVEAHDGTIEVQSAAEQGTTFQVHLPIGLV